MPPETEAPDEERVERILLEASVARGRGDHAKALALLDGAEALAPGDPRVWDARGDIHFERAHYDRAIECYRKALELDPNHEESQEKLGIASIRRFEAVRLTSRTPAEASATARQLRRRSQTAMAATLFCPGLGHILIDQPVRGGVFMAVAILAFITLRLLWAANEVQLRVHSPTHMLTYWGVYATIGILVVTWIIAFYDASRRAALRDDESLY
jgi:tetratricopeptide (TPR) repeat protein